MENKRGSGIFLGVVSVATLIVAIIGATFAFFSASVSSEDRVTAQAYEFNATMSITQVYPNKSTNGMIPLDPDALVEGSADKENLLFALNEATDKCIDDNGYQVCALYQVTVTNGGTQPINLAGKLTTTANNATTSGRSEATAFANLTYQSVTGSHTDNTLSLVNDPVGLISGNTTPDLETIEVDGSIVVSGMTVQGGTNVPNEETPDDTEDTIFQPGTGTSYVLIYLNDNGDQSAEMGATWEGSLEYTSTSGDGNTLTGSFSITGGV